MKSVAQNVLFTSAVRQMIFHSQTKMYDSEVIKQDRISVRIDSCVEYLIEYHIYRSYFL